MDLLKKAFGGNYYDHGVGYVWILSKREALKDLLGLVRKEEGVS